jgi:spore germination protein D
MLRHLLAAVACSAVVFTSACSASESVKETDYDTTKKMVVDILQTDDGKKALQELMAEEDMKEKLIIESDTMKKTVNHALTSEKGAEMWKKLFEDPEFVEQFAKSMSEEQQKLIKKLMHDADYQKQMLELLQNPEIKEQMLDVLKSQQFRSHLEETIQQTLDTPLFQAKMKETLLKAAEKQENKKQQDSGDKTK